MAAIAVGSAIASIVGIALLAGTWPGSPTELRSMLNTGIAMAMNAAVLLALLWQRWPAQEMFGKRAETMISSDGRALR